MLTLFETSYKLDKMVHDEIVTMSGRALPPEVADMCGDFAQFTPERRELYRFN